MAATACRGGGDGGVAVMPDDDDDDLVDVVLDLNIDDLDLMLEAAAAEFHDAYTAFLASANGSGTKKSGGWMAGSRGDGDGGGSPEMHSCVTTDAAGDDDEEAMTAYVSELERFLLMDDDGLGEGGEQAAEGLASVHDYFGDLLHDGEVVCGVAAPAGGGGQKKRGEENHDDVLAAREDDESASRKRARYE